MNYIYAEKVVSTEAAKKKLEKCKEEERNTKMYSRRISPTTVVYCKREDRLDEYDKMYNKKERM